MRTKIRRLLDQTDHSSLVGQEHTIKGWIKTVRSQKNLTFIEVNDGSSFANLQVVAEAGLKGLDAILPQITTGASIDVTGVIAESPGEGQTIELHANTLKIIGEANAESYPLQKKGTPLSFYELLPICALGPIHKELFFEYAML